MERKYYKHKLENLIVISKIVTIHYFEFDKDFKGHTESHDFWELVYAEKGNLISTTDGKVTLLKEGEITFYKPGVSHFLQADGKKAPNVFITSFECKNEAIRYFEDKHMTLDKRLLRFIFAIIEESKRTFNLPHSDPDLKKMEFNANPPLGGQQVIKNYLELLLIELMRSESEKKAPSAVFLMQDQYDEVISDMLIKYMNDHIEENISIEELCADLHYNRSYIYRQFKKTTGTSIMSYFNNMKIKRAKELLRETKLSISDISERLSFDNANYFSKVFKKHVGYTPSSYRKIKIGKRN